VKKLIIVPDGWKCKLNECPPGFFVYDNQLCFKTEYGKDEVYCSSGETFCVDNPEVQPVVEEWVKEKDNEQ
jgi:hypothetical protein